METNSQKSDTHPPPLYSSRGKIAFFFPQAARASFRQVLTDSTQRLNALSKKLGTCIEKARPYYEARMKAKEVKKKKK